MTTSPLDCRWGDKSVVAAYSPDRRFNYGSQDPQWGRVLMSPDRKQIQFREYIDDVIAGRNERAVRHAHTAGCRPGCCPLVRCHIRSPPAAG